MLNFTLQITNWYRQNSRDLPWRQTKDPYLIWLSEIILQQTRVEQGLPYYLKFTKNYPKITDLARANEDEILLLWQGLGYYSRGRNMLKTAQFIVDYHAGKFPQTYNELLQLKGIGSYTAAAIASFAFKEVSPVIDGNVYRVLTRYFGIDTAIDSIQGKKEILELARLTIDKNNPDVYNQAIVEFGAMQCKPKNPNCIACPLADSCISLSENKVQQRPIKSKKIKVSTRFFHYFLVQNTNNYIIEKRLNNDIWKGLYQFPLIELDSIELPDKIEQEIVLKKTSKIFTHKLTHQNIYAVFHECSIIPEIIKNNETRTSIQNLEDYALPVLIHRFLKTVD